jgi:glycosyltransferase involved in cell wall biosynthesis
VTDEVAPAVSVVIPSFRGGPLLREAIASVQAQTLQEWEAIVVLDGCEDDLSDIESSDGRVRVLRQRNRGASTARNAGIGQARAALVALLDDDDRMLPGRLLAQRDVMADPAVGACHTQFRVIDESGAVIGAGGSKESQYVDFLRGDGAILVSSMMVRRTLIHEAGGFNPLYPLGEDLDFAYRIAREAPLRFLPEVHAEYRVHGSNTWAGSSKGGALIKLTLRQHLYAAEARGESANVRAIRRGLSLIPSDRVGAVMQRAKRARERNDRAAMLGALGEAFLLSPAFTLRAVVREVRRGSGPGRGVS